MLAMPTVLINAVGARTGGAVTHLHAVVPRLRNFPEYQFVVYVNEEVQDRLPPPPPNVSLRPLVLGAGLRRWIWDQTRLPRLATSGGADVLLSLLNHGPRSPRVPQVILQANATYFSREKSHLSPIRRLEIALRRRMAIEACRSSALVLTPSAATQRDLLRWIEHPNVQVLPHGIDTSWFQASPDHLRDLPVGLNLDSSPRFVYVAHVAAYKGHRELLDAFRTIRTNLPSSALALTFDRYGSAANGPSDLIEQLAHHAETIPGVSLVGQQTHVGVRALYQWADIVLFPSRLETFGFPLIEAMSMSKPVIASDTPSLIELGGGIALHHPAGDGQQLAALAMTLAKDSARREHLSVKGRERALLFDWDRHVEKLMRHIGSVIP